MNILSVGYPLHPAGPDSGGGAEQILSLIERGLEAAGHHSIVIAAKGSRVTGDLIETPVANGTITDEIRRSAQNAHRDRIEQTLAHCEVDLIHFHGLDFHSYLPKSSVPMVVTLHLPLSWYPDSIFQLSNINLVCVSQSQADSAPAGADLTIIPNGVDLERHRISSHSKEILLFIGRICPEKGVHIALEIAHALDLPAVVAGPVHPFRDHQVYFQEKVEPLLDRKRCYAGPVTLDGKRELLSRAKCLLIPSLVAETSSLVAMEAIACGVPVVAYGSGALPEIVDEGETGFIACSQEQMRDAISRVSEISPAICRTKAEARFDARRMLRNYLDLYLHLARND